MKLNLNKMFKRTAAAALALSLCFGAVPFNAFITTVKALEHNELPIIPVSDVYVEHYGGQVKLSSEFFTDENGINLDNIFEEGDLKDCGITDGKGTFKIKKTVKFTLYNLLGSKVTPTYVSNSGDYNVYTFEKDPDILDYYLTKDGTGHSVRFIFCPVNPDPLVVEDGGTAERPADPEKEGYAFVGWKIADTETFYDFSAPVTSNTVLAAEWQKLGDIDLNSRITKKDPALLLHYLSTKQPFDTDEALNAKKSIAADADQNGVIDMRDAVIVIRIWDNTPVETPEIPLQ